MGFSLASRTASGMPPIVGFRHAGITVEDMERSLAFYCGLLGLRATSDRISPDGGASVGAPGASIRICMLEVPGSSDAIELLEYRGADGRSSAVRPVDFGAGHVSFWVSDADRLHAALVEQGVAVQSPPMRAASGRKKFYAQDPDGVWLEFTEAQPDGA